MSGAAVIGRVACPESSAVVSVDGAYRYRLDRAWLTGPRVCWVMLNPSTADAMADDPTIRRCIGYAKAWGYSGITVVNLFAYRATNPRELENAADPIGPENAIHASVALDNAGIIIAAWGGSFPKRHVAHVAAASDQLRDRGAHVLGLTAAGQPKHPLYLRGDLKPQRWTP